MDKQIGTSLLLAAVVALGLVSSAWAGDFNGTEEDLAVPQGSFVSTMAVPVIAENVSHIARSENGENQPVVVLTGTEEDLAVPQGSFTSTTPFPNVRGDKVKVANATARKNVAAGVE